jgi:hypothetical protein
LDEIKGLSPQVKVIRFEVLGETEPFRGGGYEIWGGELLDDIEDLAVYRSAQGRPFWSVLSG